MAEAVIVAIIWVMVTLVLMGFIFYVFGFEMPIYLLLMAIGFMSYTYSDNPGVKFVGGFIGRFFATLFIISMMYYLGTKTFFPADPFNFRFLSIGIQFSVDFFNNISNFIGRIVLNLFNSIIP